jgi:hypothetical protein
MVHRLAGEFLALLDLTVQDGAANPEVWASFGDWCLIHVVEHMRHHAN